MAATASQVVQGPVLDVERVRRDFPILDRTVNGRPLCIATIPLTVHAPKSASAAPPRPTASPSSSPWPFSRERSSGSRISLPSLLRCGKTTSP